MNRVNLKNIEEKLPKIDLFIGAISFEERCFSFLNSISTDNTDIGKIWFSFNENEQEFYSENIEKAKQFKQCEFLKFSTDDPLVSSKTLLDKFQDLSNVENTVVDISTFTHEGLLILIKFLDIFKEKVGAVHIVYIGAIEYSINEINDDDKWLSKGIKTIRSVLGYPGIINPSQKNHLIILFGFESERTSKLIESFEFEKVSIGIGPEDDSIQSNHYLINRQRHIDLIKTYPFAETFEFSLTDPHYTQKQIEQQVEKYDNYNVVIAPLNNKLSTVGVALAALSNHKLQLCYIRAHEYNYKGYSKPSEVCYYYKLL